MGKKLKVFISYRRADSTDFAGRIHDNLMQKSATYDVFLDTEDGIPSGEKFLKVIVKNIQEADVFLMVVGKKSDKEFQEREGKDDYVIKEILEAKNVACSIIPVLMHGVKGIEYLPKELDFVKELSYYEFAHPKFSLNFNGLKNEIDKVVPKQKALQKILFTQEVMQELLHKKLVVLFSQDSTDILLHYESIKTEVQRKFSNEFYTVVIPSFVDESEEYFSSVGSNCGLSCEVKKVSDWNKAMQEKLKSNTEPLLFFISNLENGDEVLNKQFATILQNLRTEFSHFHAILVGRKKLATLVYGEGSLSPLNSASELFFPEQEMQLGERKITQEFNSMAKYKEQICKLLKREKIARFAAWSHNETINSLFWKNLLVKKGSHLVWRGEFTKEIARDVLGCEP